MLLFYLDVFIQNQLTLVTGHITIASLNQEGNKMKIQLDTQAMERLFPEGSQSRVDLQNAVIVNFAKKIQENKIDDAVVAEVRNLVGEVSDYTIDRKVKIALSEHVGRVDSYWGKATVDRGNRMDTAIDELVSTKVDNLIAEYNNRNNETVASRMKQINGIMERKIQESFDNHVEKLDNSISVIVKKTSTRSSVLSCKNN